MLAAKATIAYVHDNEGTVPQGKAEQIPTSSAKLTSGIGIGDSNCISQGAFMIKKHYIKFQNSKTIAKLSRLLNATQLWEFTPNSIEKGIALGVACSWIPLPFHTTIAVFLAIVIDCNILMVITSIWVANPITMPLMYYSAYKFGAYIMAVNESNLQFHLSIKDMLHDLHAIWQPFLLGCTIFSITSGIITYSVLKYIWPGVQRKIRSKHRQ